MPPSTAKHEYLAIAFLALTALIFLIPAALHARQIARDDMRKIDLSQFKRTLEHYHNQHDHYLTPPTDVLTNQPTLPLCTNQADPDSWFFGPSSPLRANGFLPTMPTDPHRTHRTDHAHSYTYCVTELSDKATTTGYYVETTLEQTIPSNQLGTGFDEDEQRKYHYRQLAVPSKTTPAIIKYRVCGGTETQCQSDA